MSDQSATIELDVTGMTCAACQANVQRALVRQPGVRDASVNLLTGQALVQVDPLVVTPGTLIEAVQDVGYDASVPSPDTTVLEAQAAGDAAAAAETAYLTRRAVVSGALGLAAMVASMPLMAPIEGHEHGGDPFMRWAMDRLAPVVHAGLPWLYGASPASLRWGLLTVTAFVMGWAGGRLYASGWRALVHRAPDMNSLVALGTAAAFAFSAVATLAPDVFVRSGAAPDVYFESVVIILAMVLTGRALEARAKRRTATAIHELLDLRPTHVTIVEFGHERVVALDEVRTGWLVQVRPGQRVPVDGQVVEGHSAIDESMITGEPVPVPKRIGDTVTGGTLNGGGALVMRATAVGAQTRLAQIVRLMRNAQASRPAIQQLSDRVSAVFVPTILVTSLATVLAWLALGGGEAVVHALSAGVAVLIIACPCAMGLAVPTAIMVASGRGSAAGVLFKSGQALQRVGEADVVVIDKTGTLTEGRPTLLRMDAVPASEADALLAAAASLGRVSEHPLASALVRGAEARGLPLSPVTDFSSTAGAGMSGVVDGQPTIVGSWHWLEQRGIDPTALHEAIDAAARDGASVVCAATGASVGLFAITDPLRPTARTAVSELHALGVRVVMVTGDRREPAERVAAELGIQTVVSDARPDSKLDAVARFQRDGHVVAMVGDGINDGPSLAQADVGVAMGSGTDVAMEAADLALMRNDLGGLVSAVRLSRRTIRTVKQNLFWAFVYNVVGVPIAAGVLYPRYGVLLSPVLASAAMAFSSVSVVANSLRLRRTPI